LRIKTYFDYDTLQEGSDFFSLNNRNLPQFETPPQKQAFSKNFTVVIGQG